MVGEDVRVLVVDQVEEDLLRVNESERHDELAGVLAKRKHDDAYDLHAVVPKRLVLLTLWDPVYVH